jgi:hypothetical protein
MWRISLRTPIPPEQIPLRIAGFCQRAFLSDRATVAIVPRMKL